MHLKFATAAVLAVGLLTAAAGTAEARQGCGPGFHRGYYGVCHPNLGFYGPGWHRWHHPWGWHRYYGWHRHWR